jgi:cytochrome c-type biogenesis protein CcmH/NrfG
MDYLSLCLMCKDENDYLPEWLDYHILMGVDRFYIYDNESQISLRESLKEYIERGWVVVVDISGKAMQLYSYDHCLQTFGANTFWLGFIDTDEFLVPKTTLDLKELLKDYESYGGLAISTFFFGSNSHKTRPEVGQIAAYTRRTHKTFKENEWVKSIIQPKLVMMPNSPHDFIYKENAWCVNESFLRVDGQRFPNCTELIQLNHYFCRSEQEIDQKLSRGNSGSVIWPRRLFNAVNFMATYQDTDIINNLGNLFQRAHIDSHGLLTASEAPGLLNKIATVASVRYPALLEMIPPPRALIFRTEFSNSEALRAQTQAALDRKEFEEVKRLILIRLQMMPQNIILYVDLSVNLLDMNDPVAAWQVLTQAWQLSPNNYIVLSGMAFYFLRVKNFCMAEKTCRLLFELAPHDMVALGMMTHSLIGQGRYEEALKVGVPVVELAGQLGELPERMGVFLVKKMADYLLEKKDYTGAARLWQAGVQCQPGDVNNLLELARCLLLAGDITGMRRYLTQAQSLAPKNEEVLALLRMDALAQRSEQDSAVPHPLKRIH